MRSPHELLQTPADRPPDWQATTVEVLCPLCDYNLRGLIEPRCPECGHRFAWPEMLEALDRRHPYLFEHHPRRNIWSFFRTLTGSMRPQRFWRTLQPVHTIHERRLILYWLLVAMVFTVLALAGVVYQVHQQYVGLQALRAIGIVISDPDFFAHSAAPYAMTLLGWPWLTYAALLLYRTTLRQSRIRSAHVLRCAVYTSAAGMVLSLPLMAAVVFIDLDALTPWGTELWFWRGAVNLEAVACCVLWVCWTTPALAVAYRRYLNFPRTIPAVIASQIIVLLVCLKFLFVLHDQ